MACIDAHLQVSGNRTLGGPAVTVAIYLGLDSSTQSVTATAVEVDDAHPDRRAILFERSFRYDDDAAAATAPSMACSRSADPRTVHAPPLMWSEALDRMIAELVRDTTSTGAGCARSPGSAQQHGSVYVNARRRPAAAALDPSQPLADQLERRLLTRDVADLDGLEHDERSAPRSKRRSADRGALAPITGSRAFERFTGPQIRKFAEEDPAAYAATDRVHLVSSWLASLLAGTHAAIDPGDGSGMNLMDLASKQWSPDARPRDGPGPRRQAAAARRIVDDRSARSSPYWQQRYNLPPARVVAWSGDNPCSLVGTGLVREGIVAISLGTSDTIFGIMPTPRPSDDGTGHVFASPTGAYMGMTVFKNGSLARERVRDAYRMDWPAFSAALARTPAGNDGATLLPWFDPEITPLVLTPASGGTVSSRRTPMPTSARVVEAQMMSLALHSRWMGVRISTIYATGGASANRDMLQVMADVFDAEVFQLETGNSAALGAALRAFHADRLADGKPARLGRGDCGVRRPAARLAPDAAARERGDLPALIEVYATRARRAGGRTEPVKSLKLTKPTLFTMTHQHDEIPGLTLAPACTLEAAWGR